MQGTGWGTHILSRRDNTHKGSVAEGGKAGQADLFPGAGEITFEEGGKSQIMVSLLSQD